jgi:hypothetical protein
MKGGLNMNVYKKRFIKRYLKKAFLIVLFLTLLVLVDKMNSIHALFITKDFLSNQFTITDTYTDNFIVNYKDSNDVITELGRDTQTHFVNDVVSIDNPTFVNVSGYVLESVKVDGVDSNIGNTFTQTSSPMNIVYTYVTESYNITYSGDTSDFTYSNSATTIESGQNYTSTITYNTGRDLDSVIITMDGVDISNSYNRTNNTITINNVSGDIDINITTKVKSYSITYTGNNYTSSNNATTVDHGNSFTTTITANYNYTITGATVRMGGVNITNSVVNNRTITITSVTGDIEISVTTQNNGCLAEGTKITLYNGTKKNIENIGYNDLLKVWNHDLGRYGYAYPAWIEKAGTADQYTKITFDDGNELKVISSHSVFCKRLNKYVDIRSGELQVGDEVVNLQNGISYVKVTNIEEVNESINYYHVITTRYFNLIANNILTTYEIYENVSNFMGFDEQLKWQNTEIVRSDMYTYDNFTYLDKYLFKCFRLEETKYLVDTGLVTLSEFADLFQNYLMNNNRKLPPIKNELGNRMWMVTTSDNTDLCNRDYLLEEGSTYMIPNPENEENFLYWYNHSDNKNYNPGEEIEVDSSMYLEAIYE